MKNIINTAANRRRDKILISAFSVLLALWFAFSVVLFEGECVNIRNGVVRLHILADSDSETDQNIKLAVRDALLQLDTPLLGGAATPETAVEYFDKSCEAITERANEILKENGAAYRAEVVLCREYYPVREYGSLSFPAGEYTSVKVVLGSGTGHNWWCVMFPPLCVPAADGGVDGKDELLDEYFDVNTKRIISSEGKYKVKFKLAEWYERLFK